MHGTAGAARWRRCGTASSVARRVAVGAVQHCVRDARYRHGRLQARAPAARRPRAGRAGSSGSARTAAALPSGILVAADGGLAAGPVLLRGVRIEGLRRPEGLARSHLQALPHRLRRDGRLRSRCRPPVRPARPQAGNASLRGILHGRRSLDALSAAMGATSRPTRRRHRHLPPLLRARGVARRRGAAHQDDRCAGRDIRPGIRGGRDRRDRRGPAGGCRRQLAWSERAVRAVRRIPRRGRRARGRAVAREPRSGGGRGGDGGLHHWRRGARGTRGPAGHACWRGAGAIRGRNVHLRPPVAARHLVGRRSRLWRSEHAIRHHLLVLHGAPAGLPLPSPPSLAPAPA